MKVGVACDGQEVSPHFGRCEKFIIAEIDQGEVQLVELLPNPGHEPGLLPALMQEKGVECVLTGGAGPRAINLFNQVGIELVGGVSGDPLVALQALALGRLTEGESTCAHGFEE